MDVNHEHERDRLHRLEMVGAICAALDRRGEVFDIVNDAQDPESATEAIEALLGIGRQAAVAVLDLQLRRFSGSERARLYDQRDRLLRDAPFG